MAIQVSNDTGSIRIYYNLVECIIRWRRSVYKVYSDIITRLNLKLHWFLKSSIKSIQSEWDGMFK